MEIERKYLLRKLPEGVLNNCERQEILQGYLQIEPDEVRVRKKGENCFLTRKSEGHLSREEVEVEISTEIFDILWPLTESKRIEKIRYTIPFEDLMIEIDVYNNGRTIAEVELPSEDYQFNKPEWFDKELTYDKRYKNKNLAIYGFPEDT